MFKEHLMKGPATLLPSTRGGSPDVIRNRPTSLPERIGGRSLPEWFKAFEVSTLGQPGDNKTAWLRGALTRAADHIRDVPGMEDFRHHFDLSASRTDVPFEIFVIGEGKFGKSTFINALFGADVSPVGLIPKTYCFHRFIAHSADSEVAFLVTQDLKEDPSWSHIRDALGKARPEQEGQFLRYACRPETAREIVSGEEGRIGPGRTYRTPIMEIEWRLNAPQSILPGMRLVDTQGLEQILASSMHRAHLEWEYQRADAVIWLVSAVKVRSAVTEEYFRLFGRYSKPTVLVLNQIDRIPSPDAARVVAEARQAYGARGFDIVPFSAKKACAARRQNDPALLEECGMTNLADLLQSKFLAKQSLVRNRTVYVTARQRQREYRHGLGVLREAALRNVAIHDEACTSTDLLSLQAGAAVGDAVSEYRRRLHGDLGGRYEGIGYEDDQQVVQDKLRVATVGNSLTAFQGDLQRSLNAQFQEHMASLSKKKYQWPELSATGEAREFSVYPRVGETDWRIEPGVFRIELSVSTSWLGRLEVGLLDFAGLFFAAARENAQRKRAEMTREKRKRIREEMTMAVDGYLDRIGEAYQLKARTAASRIRQAVREQIERLGGLEKLRRLDEAVTAKLTEFVLPTAFVALTTAAMTNLHWPKEKNPQ